MRTLGGTLITLVSALLVAACGDGGAGGGVGVVVDTLPNGAVRTISAAPVDSGRWSFELLREIQPPEGDPGEILQPTDVDITDDGTVLVAEGGAAHVKVFGPDGSYLRTIGGTGEGPGEFRVAFLATRGDTLFVQDPRVARGSTFLISTGEFLTSRLTACCYWAPVGIDGSGRAVLSAMRRERADSQPSMTFVRAVLGSTAADTVDVPYRRASGDRARWEVRDGDRMQMTVTVPLRPQELQVADPRGAFVTAWSGEYLLRATSDGQDTTALYGRPFSPLMVTSVEKQALVDARVASMRAGGGPTSVPEQTLRAAFVVDYIPDVRPPFERFSLDAAGRTWVQRSYADTSVVEFDLFDTDRRWLDIVRAPGSLWPSATWTPIAWGRELVAVPGEDADGRPLVRVFRVVRRGS
jgi:hypothetical protein